MFIIVTWLGNNKKFSEILKGGQKYQYIRDVIFWKLIAKKANRFTKNEELFLAIKR